MQRGLINARESLVKFSPFGNFILFVKFKDQEMPNLNKFVQLLSDKTGAAADSCGSPHSLEVGGCHKLLDLVNSKLQ